MFSEQIRKAKSIRVKLEGRVEKPAGKTRNTAVVNKKEQEALS